MKRLKSTEEQFEVYRSKFDLLLKDKINMEKFNIKQEQNIKSLEMEIQSLNDECKEKDQKYKQLDKTYLSIIHIIEKQKKNIRNLQDKLTQKQKDENNKIKIIQEKEQEIGILKGFINSLKNELETQNRIIDKLNNENDELNSHTEEIKSKYNKEIQKKNEISENHIYNYSLSILLTLLALRQRS